MINLVRSSQQNKRKKHFNITLEDGQFENL